MIVNLQPDETELAMRKTVAKVEVGTVIEGTLKPEILALSFFQVLERIDEDAAEEYRASVEAMEEPEYLVDDLMSSINDRTPEGFYFGAHPGDGADFGFWETEED